jgi:Cof subfamily protein (haloacid dehalogenase superfamily)
VIPSSGPRARPRLLALDIDGTILDRYGALRVPVRDALRRVSQSGVHVILATGRSPWHGIAELMAELGLSGPQVTMQGALIVDPVSGVVERVRTLPPEVYRAGLGFARELAIEPVVAVLDGHRASGDPDAPIVPWTGPDLPTFKWLPDLAELGDERPARIFLPTSAADHRRVRLAAMERFLGIATVVWGDLTGVELIAADTSKGEAVGWLGRSRGVGLEAVAAAGDAWNDIQLLRMAGRSAAMGGAPDEVRAAADIVVPSSDEDGILDALAWFFPDLAEELGRADGEAVAASA